jgi:hypothetical protein
MFEHKPFSQCPRCGEANSFGLLSVRGHALTLRCKDCGYTKREPLPQLNKKVIYFDQFAFSELFKIEAGTRRASAPHENFWLSLHQKMRHVLLLQQAVFPSSDIHSDETTVYLSPQELRHAYERLGGSISFIDSRAVSRRQVCECLAAYREQRSPEFDLSVDSILRHPRNEWLPDMHVAVNADYSHFADAIRSDVEQTAANMEVVVRRWAATKPSFAEVLREELEAYGKERVRMFLELQARSTGSTHPSELFPVATYPVTREFMDLLRAFQESGLPEPAAVAEVIRFWQWPGNWEQPKHRISAFMFAALARKVASGQRKPTTRGFINDVNAIASYAPYVDAMFIDKECAAFLREAPLKQELKLRARIFSLNTRDGLLDYLDQLEKGTPAEVRLQAEWIYGLG